MNASNKKIGDMIKVFSSIRTKLKKKQVRNPYICFLLSDLVRDLKSTDAKSDFDLFLKELDDVHDSSFLRTTVDVHLGLLIENMQSDKVKTICRCLHLIRRSLASHNGIFSPPSLSFRWWYLTHNVTDEDGMMVDPFRVRVMWLDKIISDLKSLKTN